MTHPIVSNIISIEYFKEHLYTAYFIIVPEIPFVIILITNIFLIDGLNKKSWRKQEMTSDRWSQYTSEFDCKSRENNINM
jgi:hypothetical protein